MAFFPLYLRVAGRFACAGSKTMSAGRSGCDLIGGSSQKNLGLETRPKSRASMKIGSDCVSTEIALRVGRGIVVSFSSKVTMRVPVCVRKLMTILFMSLEKGDRPGSVAVSLHARLADRDSDNRPRRLLL